MILIFVSLLQSGSAIVNIVIWLDYTLRNFLFTLHVRWIHTNSSLIDSAGHPAKDSREAYPLPDGLCWSDSGRVHTASFQCWQDDHLTKASVHQRFGPWPAPCFFYVIIERRTLQLSILLTRDKHWTFLTRNNRGPSMGHRHAIDGRTTLPLIQIQVFTRRTSWDNTQRSDISMVLVVKNYSVSQGDASFRLYLVCVPIDELQESRT